ncbi:MAG: PD-(D/E)XK nuclease family protein [Taibaiella sp.]|nr:PD-(D/E)XK nuclease family protein [Taibaiella sp.]
MIDPDISSFFSGLEATIAYAKKYQENNSEEFAFEFNPLIHFYDKGENQLSDMLAFFLDPEEKHGQKRLFVDIFLKELGLTEIVGFYTNVRVKREQPTDERRKIDIVLFFDNRYAIGVENKIWAPDQNMQVSDYYDWLDKHYPNRFSLIYLTPYGHSPSAIDESRKIIIKDHSTFTINLIKLWAEKCKADKVRHFLKDFSQFVDNEIKGCMFVSVNRRFF